MVINPIVGVYIPIIRIPIKGGMTIPNIATFDHGTCIVCLTYILVVFLLFKCRYMIFHGFHVGKYTIVPWIRHDFCDECGGNRPLPRMIVNTQDDSTFLIVGGLRFPT